MDLGLKGRKAIVTGASRGIGRSIAEGLAVEGCDVAICARGEDGVRDAVASLEALGVRSIGSAFNVRDGEAYGRWLSQTCESLGGLDLFVANVSSGSGADNSERDWYRNFEIDLLATVRGCEAVVPALKRSDAPAVVLIGDAAATETAMAPLAYNALKAALVTHAKQLSQELFVDNIRVNVVSPGPTLHEGSKWDMLQFADPTLFKATVRQHPARRLGESDEIARCVLFLASPAASWVNGTHLLVDGGFSRRVQF
jgi:3-oxoacyl-[acyl-carrier protein] reductase